MTIIGLALGLSVLGVVFLLTGDTSLTLPTEEFDVSWLRLKTIEDITVIKGIDGS